MRTVVWVLLGLSLAIIWGGPIRREVRRSRRWRSWADELHAQGPTSWLDVDAPATLLAHVTAAGEVIDFPIIRGETIVSLATTLGEIAALPEVAA